MTTGRVAAIAAACVLPVGVLAALVGPSPAGAAPPPTHDVTVIGDGVAGYPEFSESVDRYGVTTTDDTDGTVTVSATSSDPSALFWVDGRRDADGTATVTGLVDGDEVSVWIDDAAGRSSYSFVYLPAGFPTLEAETAPGADLAEGAVLLGLSNTWLRGYPGQEPGVPDFYEAAVDRRGVPLHVEGLPSLARSLDLKSQPNGHYSVARPTTTPGRTGEAIIELDDRFHEVARHETVGLVNTDGHDAILLPDGTQWLMAYERDATGTWIDSVIQRIDPDGSVGFQWSSDGLQDETVAAGPDYAHLNSFELMPDGSVLASFRNLDAVLKIDTSTPTGSIVWKLGGRDSDFAFLDEHGDPDGGPCAQHSARLLPDGHVVLFDNGSTSFIESLCLAPGDPTGPTVQRPVTRAIELALDPQAGIATIVRSTPGGLAWFAGSTEPLPGGGLMIGWASDTHAVATELDPDGDVAWELRDPDPDPAQRYFSYRAHLADVPDATPPTVSLDLPATVVQGDPAPATWTCADRGGSGLAACDGSVEQGASVDTSTPGVRTVSVTATDGAGNPTTVSWSVRVRASYRPDAVVRVQGRGAWVGGDTYGASSTQRVAASLRRPSGRVTVLVRLQNDGARPDTLHYEVRGTSGRFQVSPRPLTGTQTPLLQPGESWTVKVYVTRLTRAEPGDSVLVRVPTRSAGDGSVRDGVSARVTARR